MKRLSAIAVLVAAAVSGCAAKEAAVVPVIPFDASIAAMNFVAKGGAVEEEANAIEGLVANSLRDLGYREVTSSADVLSILQLEMVKQRAGCESTACLAEIAGALGVDYTVGGELTHVDERTLLNLQLVAPDSARAVHGVSRAVRRGQVSMIDVVPGAVAELMGRGEEGGGVVTVERARPMRGIDVAKWTGLGGTVALGSATILIAALAAGDDAAMGGEVRGTDDWENLEKARDDKALVADIFIGLTAAAAVTTGVLFWVAWGDDEDPSAATTGVSVAVRPGPGSAAVEVRF